MVWYVKFKNKCYLKNKICWLKQLMWFSIACINIDKHWPCTFSCWSKKCHKCPSASAQPPGLNESHLEGLSMNGSQREIHFGCCPLLYELHSQMVQFQTIQHQSPSSALLSFCFPQRLAVSTVPSHSFGLLHPIEKKIRSKEWNI